MFDWLRKKLRGTPAPRTPEPLATPETAAPVPKARPAGPIPWGCWVWMQLPWEFQERFLGYVYVDPDAGLSAKGDRESVAELAERPGVTVRLPMGFPLRALTAEEVAARGLPATPAWLVHFGPQPAPASPWRQDPHLQGRFHESHPNDLEVLVHDGEPRRTGRRPELCWVRVLRAERGPSRRVLYRPGQTQLSQEEFQRRYSGDTWVYVARLLNAPHGLQDIHQGEELRFLSGAGLYHPLHVTPQYLQEREGWHIAPCDKCGWSEAFDPPSVMARFRFPDMPPDAELEGFTSFCPMCDGVQLLSRVDPADA
ncbi:hypothetical protein [Pyxidicoccus caerfyrddinensis]|uniref:hypothetical protein n=1 Tax=Pyxidicoccus caerfyrddinensis TaxID=2709663 RepID=UPI0013DA2F97|nr:hypothetical protein [Pyxidicoccus caerfyrddinensis]